MPITNLQTQEKILNLDEIFKDDGIYPREMVDERRIDFFSDLMKEGTIFPPIKIVQDKSGRHILLDGFHRYSACKKIQRNQILCDLIDAEPQMWRLLSVRFNFDSSQPLKFGEIKKAIFDTWLIDKVRDKQQIADMLGCSVQWVRKVVKDLDQEEEEQKLALARKIKEEENSSIRDIADRVGWSKSKTHRMLTGHPEDPNVNTNVKVPVQPAPEADTTPENQPKSPEPLFRNAEKIIESFNKFQHQWEPDQKETLYAFDGMIKDLPVGTISENIGKNPAWIRNAAYILLSLCQQDEHQPEQLFEISENLSVNIERTNFVNYLFTYWKNTLPGRKLLFQWVLNNQTQYRDDRISRLIRFEHLFWHSKNIDAEKLETDESGSRLLRELPPETYSRLSQITTYFEDLKKYLRNYEIETGLARDLLERVNLIMISQNRIQDHLHRFI